MARKTRKVTVRRYTPSATLDRYRNPVPGYVDELAEIYALAPRESFTERDGARVVIVTGGSLFAPAGFTLGPRDLVVDNGREYRLDGEPGKWDDNPVGPGTLPGGVQINLTRSTG